MKTDAAYRQAVLNGDVKTLGFILADDVLIVHSDGARDDKKNFIDAISTGRLKMRSYERLNIEVRVHGSTALLVSQTKKIFDYKSTRGEDNDTSTVTYVKQADGWRMVAMQNTHRRD